MLSSSTVTQTLNAKPTVVEAQYSNFSHFTVQTVMNPSDGRAIFTMLMPYITERSRTCESTLPNLNVKFQVKTQASACYQVDLQFSKGTPTKEARMSLGNELMAEMSKWTKQHTNKPRLNLTIANAEGRILIQRVNIQLQPPCGEHLMNYSLLNQGIMDEIADRLLMNSSTHFVINIELCE